MTSILALHAVGDVEGGAPWLTALSRDGVSVVAPDVPGHGDAEPSVDGSYTGGLVLLTAVRSLAATETSGRPDAVLGAGTSGWVALVLALSGRASAAVLVDGLGGPWRDAAQATAEGVEWARRLLDDAASQEAVPAGMSDPRLARPMPGFSNERVARQAIAALQVPLLVVSSPADPLSSAERDDLLSSAVSPTKVVTVATARPTDLAAPIVEWLGTVGAAGGVDVPTAGEGPE